METVQAINMIAVNPDIRRGRAYILGTSVTVSDIAIAKLHHGLDGDGLADWYGLTLPQVYAALAYYYAHKIEIDQQIQSQIRRSESMKEKRVGGETSLLPR